MTRHTLSTHNHTTNTQPHNAHRNCLKHQYSTGTRHWETNSIHIKSNLTNTFSKCDNNIVVSTSGHFQPFKIKSKIIGNHVTPQIIVFNEKFFHLVSVLFLKGPSNGLRVTQSNPCKKIRVGRKCHLHLVVHTHFKQPTQLGVFRSTGYSCYI